MKRPHRILFSQSPLAQLAAAFATGILASEYLHLRLSVAISAGALLTLAAVITLSCQKHLATGLILLMAMCSAGAIVSTLTHTRHEANGLSKILEAEDIGERETVVLTGILNGPTDFARDRLYLTLRIYEIRVEGSPRTTNGVVSVRAVFKSRNQEQGYRSLDLRYGDRVQVSVTLRRNDQFRNPGVSTLTEFLERQGWDAVGLLKSPNSVIKLNELRTFSLLRLLYDWRQRLQSEIDSRFNAETAGVLDAALLGNRYNLTAEVTERFRAGGTFHVLVISGFHISFLGGLVFLGARRLTGNRIAQFLLSAGVVWCYSLAVGAEVSVVRAALMFSFVGFASVVFRNSSSLNALGAAALLILVFRPRDLFDPSFQLTFLSVLAIIALAWPIIQRLGEIGKWYPTRHAPYPPTCQRWVKSLSESLFWSQREWKTELKRSTHNYRLQKSPVAVWLDRYRLQQALRYIFGAVVISLSVQLVLLPLMVVYFHRVSLSAIALNIVVGALLGLLTILSVVALIFQQFSASLALPFVIASNTINSLMVHSVGPFTRIGVDSIRLPEYTGTLRATYFFYYLPLLWLLMRLSRWQPLGRPEVKPEFSSPYGAALLQLILVAVVVFHPGSKVAEDGRLHVEFLDVGQGDSALVIMPDGTTMLLDGGGRPNFLGSSNEQLPAREQRSIGETVVSEYLWWRGLDRIDYILATHADADHIDGLNDVVRNFAVRSAIVARVQGEDPEFARFAETLKKTNTPLTVVSAGDVLLFGPVSGEVLSPASTTGSSSNDDSLVLRLHYGSRAILLTGDIEKKAEAALVSAGRELRADVVKVAHHGSRTSSTEAFVDVTRPTAAVISVGLTSMFGHPHKEVVERWQSRGVQLLTTGRCGTVSVSTDGSDLAFTTYKPC